MNLTLPIFIDPEAARAHLESLLWPSGKPVCPHCGVEGENTLVQGKSHRPGMYMCNACRKPFSVTVGTVMEKSHIPLNKWVLGFHLMASSKKGVSAHQLHRQLGITYKAAWFLAHRIREAMAPAAGSEPPLGGQGKVVEADETELSGSHKSKRKPRSKNLKFVSLIERGGRVRSHKITGASRPISIDIHEAMASDIDPASTLHTDGAKHYKYSKMRKSHEAVDHNKQYVRDGKTAERVHCNTAEGYFSLFKRGLVGTYHHMSEQHLPRYLAEFDFRMNNRVKLGVNDTMRAERAIKGVAGKRLTYHTVSG